MTNLASSGPEGVFRLSRRAPHFVWTWSSFLWCLVGVEVLLLVWAAGMVPAHGLDPYAEMIRLLYGVEPGTIGLVDFLPALNLVVVVLLWLGSRLLRTGARQRVVHRWTCVAAAACLAAASLATIVSAPPPRPLATAVVVVEPDGELGCDLRAPASSGWIQRLCAPPPPLR